MDESFSKHEPEWHVNREGQEQRQQPEVDPDPRIRAASRYGALLATGTIALAPEAARTLNHRFRRHFWGHEHSVDMPLPRPVPSKLHLEWREFMGGGNTLYVGLAYDRPVVHIMESVMPERLNLIRARGRDISITDQRQIRARPWIRQTASITRGELYPPIWAIDALRFHEQVGPSALQCVHPKDAVVTFKRIANQNARLDLMMIYDVVAKAYGSAELAEFVEHNM